MRQKRYPRPLIAGLSLLLGVCLTAGAQPPSGRSGGDEPDPASVATPRLENGRPDLTGSWRSAGGGMESAGGGMFRRCSPFQQDCMEWTNQSADFVFMAPSRLDMNKPLYRPEYWDKVQALDMWTNRDDPVMTCLPLGVPRQGPPSRIFHTEDDMTMFYRGVLDGGGGYNEFRMFRLDKTEHTDDDRYAYSYFGVPVVSWEGDTLVLESIGFTDETWFGRGGYFHSADMKVIERFTRTGNTMLYEVTIEDPEVLVEPWVMNPRRLVLSENNTILDERNACTETELEQVSSQIRH